MTSRWARFAAFNAVGALGVSVQLASVWFLTAVVSVHYLVATPAAVGLAVVHNFAWHRLWTWKDRDGPLLETFARFAMTNGLLSLAGNISVMVVLVSGAHVSPVAANVVAICASGLLNFWLGDVVVFRQST
jgi:putative flippase GtrA